MYWKEILIVLSPVAIFYIIYSRYFRFHPEIVKHMESFIVGITTAVFLILASPLIKGLIASDGIVISAFVGAAFVEKILALLLIIFIHHHYPNFTITEAIISGMLYALGFAAIENIFYAVHYGLSNSIVRIFFSVPMHFTTCGILGYYLGKAKFSSSSVSKVKYIAIGFFISYLFHGFFDFILLKNGSTVYAIAIILLCLVFLLELLLTKSSAVPGYAIIKALGIRFEDWMLMWQQPRYERWISQSMKRTSGVNIPFFNWRPGILRFILFIFFIVLAIGGTARKLQLVYSLNLKLTGSEEMLLFTIFPLSIAIFIIFTEAINPEFFRYSEIKIPIITDVVVKNNKEDDDEDFFVTYDFTALNCFLRTFEPLGIGKKVFIKMEVANKYSIELESEVVWEKHIIGQSPSGSIIKFIKPGRKFYYFLIKYYLFRFRKGLVFFFKLPGFEGIKKFFARPITTMQSERCYKKGDIIFKEGDPAKEFYLVKKGQVSIYKTTEAENEKTIETNVIKEGRLFGEISVFLGQKRRVGARAKEDLILALADKGNLQSLIRSNTEFALNLFQNMAERVSNSEEVLTTNIKYLEYQKIEKQRILDSLAFFLLVILGNKLNIHERNVDLIDIKQMIKKIDDNVVIELSKIILTNRDYENETTEEFDHRIAAMFDDFYKNYMMEN